MRVIGKSHLIDPDVLLEHKRGQLEVTVIKLLYTALTRLKAIEQLRFLYYYFNQNNASNLSVLF